MIKSIRHLLSPIVRKLRGCVSTWPEEKRVNGVMNLYEAKMGYRFDINNPVTFTEKVQWYKVFYDNGILEHLVDKALFKGYIKNQLGNGFTIPMYNVYSDLRQLEKEWATLPDEFVIKSTVQSDGNFIKIIHNKSEINFSDLKKELKDWLNPYNTLINSYCRAYYRAKPRILIEQYMSQFDNQLYDYKIFCFNGEPHCVYVAMDHFKEDNYPITFYTMDWNRLDVKYGNHKNEDVPMPVHWSEMKEIASKLSQGYPFMRVDFFDTDERLYVAEMTLYPGGGLSKYDPDSFNLELGDKFILPR